jgi:hypothetical protein
VQESETLKAMTPEAAAAQMPDRPPEAEALANKMRGDGGASAAAAAAPARAAEHPSAGDAAAPSTSAAMNAAEHEDEDLEAIQVSEEDLAQLATSVDEAGRLYAIAPWMRVAGEKRAQKENESLAETSRMVLGLLPGFSVIAQRVWDGERDVKALQWTLLEGMQHDAFRGLAESLVEQLVSCTEQLEAAAEAPDEDKPMSRHALVRVIKNTNYVAQWQQRYQDLMRKQLREG